MEDLAAITALNHSGSFRKNFVKFKKKIEMLFTSLGRENLCPLSRVPPPAYGLSRAVLKTWGTVFPNTDLPAGE